MMAKAANKYPICACGDVLGLAFCEWGDEEYHMQVELDDLCSDSALIESVAPHVATAQVAAATTTATTYVPGTYLGRKCCHAMDSYELCNGSHVYLSSVYDGYKAATVPDVGIYFDGHWSDDAFGLSYIVNWPDFGLPKVADSVFDRYVNVILGHVADGETVEMGCLGSHGRTGTFLACLDIASSGYKLGPKKAIAKVRREHCGQAIENKRQEWFIRAFWARHNGRPIPRMPKPAAKKAIGNISYVNGQWVQAPTKATETTNKDGGE